MKTVLYSLLLVSALAAAESGTVIRKTDLRDKPFLDAKVLAPVATDTQVDIRGRKGAWMEVRLPNGQQGWIKLLNVRTSSGQTSSSAALSNVLRTGSSGKTVTTGVKGLTAEQINNASPNPAEVDRMNGYSVSGNEAKIQALNYGLKAMGVTPITPSNGNNTEEQQNPNMRRR
ncbi:hypothetical protein [Chitinibacter tainanensis]|uniref:hypothetical protein n=1 Tax=Chitinibacter tainanensis TaxID=230667 RepID=UPI0004198477|nr:hypothetical protein [Chitinibacter tainanensis]